VLAITFFTSQIEPRSTQVVGDLRSSRCFNFRCPALKNFVTGLPVLVAGTWVGLRLYARLDEAGFRKVVLGLLLVSGLGLVIRAS
jgi:hypothetical protein